VIRGTVKSIPDSRITVHDSTIEMLRALSILVSAFLLAGCATNAPHQVARPVTGDSVVDGKNAIESGPAKDKVLWQYRTALASMRRGQFTQAKVMLDEAIARIANVMGSDKDAKKARGYFSAEAKKTFIGEPYERAMAYYYRGILYWMDGEPDNARACFRSAMIEDSDTVNKTYAADYALFEYLDALATAKLGDDGSEAFKRAESKARLAPPPSLNPKDNVLVFVDLGAGPTKYAVGEYSQYLMFRSGNAPARSALVKVATKQVAAVPFDDLYFQATTRGGRVMDHILANKAGFKRTTDTVGNAAIVGGAVMTQHRDTQVAGLAAVGLGIISKITASATTPEADIRSWDNLPLFLSFASLQLPPGQHTLSIEFLDPGQRALPNLTKTVNVTVNPDKDSVVYVSDKSATPLNL
jgi:tetratricopeptide (TPR) repeat protein